MDTEDRVMSLIGATILIVVFAVIMAVVINELAVSNRDRIIAAYESGDCESGKPCKIVEMAVNPKE